MKKLLAILAALVFSVGAAELLQNRDFAKNADGVPDSWWFQKNATNPSYKLEDDGEGGLCVTLSGKDTGTVAVLGQNNVRQVPAGATLVISGEYRTQDIQAAGGSGAIMALMCRADQSSNKLCHWANLELAQASTWTKFSYSTRLPYDIESLHLYAELNKASGQVQHRKLSIDVQEPTHTLAKGKLLQWREAEDINTVETLTNWGADISPDYFSGRGGIAIPVEKKFAWNITIPVELDYATSFNKNRTWYLWGRAYGYMEQSRIFIRDNDKLLGFSDIKPNEQVKNGEYAGPGKYTWQLMTQFTTQGGEHRLAFESKGRMLFDAFILTDDEHYAPQLFEARELSNAGIRELKLDNAIFAEYAREGVTDKIILPITFRVTGPVKLYKPGKEPAQFHFSLPSDIKVCGVTSHFAGDNWCDSSRWGDKKLHWRKAGERKIGEQQFFDYTAELYALTRNQYLVFVKYDGANLGGRDSSSCMYYLENGDEKQTEEMVSLKHIPIEPTTPFENIYIGPGYVPFDMMYISQPDVFNNMKACGLNYMGAFQPIWTEEHDPENTALFDKFRDQAYANGFHLNMCANIYSKPGPEDIAYGIDEKPYQGKNGDGQTLVSLSMDENSGPIKQAMKNIRDVASLGLSVEIDDEVYNVLYDAIDYSPKVMALFKDWLKANHPDVQYKSPVDIVKNKEHDRDMYKIWVAFKCSRVSYWYTLYRKAFDEGVALARSQGKLPASIKPTMMACINGANQMYKTPDHIKEASYFDYKELFKSCDFIDPMGYIYRTADAANPSNAQEMYWKYTGNHNTIPIILTGGYGVELESAHKQIIKYQILESLMLKARLITFYAGATMFNATIMAPAVEAIRLARPYEKFILDGEIVSKCTSDKAWMHIRELQLGKQSLVYVANYQFDQTAEGTLDLNRKPAKVTDCDGGAKLPADGNTIKINFPKDRSRLLLVNWE